MCSTSRMDDARPRGLDLSLWRRYTNKEEKDKDKDKTTTDDNGKRKRVYPPVLYVRGSADGRSRQD